MSSTNRTKRPFQILRFSAAVILLLVSMASCGGGGGGGGGGNNQNPVPSIASLSPSSATAGASAFALTVNGSGFVSGSTVQWNGAARTTTFASGSQLSAAITSADIATAGTASVSVSTPAPGGGVSNTVTFNINQPAPSATSLSPSSTSAGSTQFTLTINGSNFVGNSVVQWNGSARPTTFVSASQLTAVIAASDVATQGTASVTVFNPAPGGGTSNPLSFTIGPPQPTITTLSPSTTLAGRTAFTLTVNGYDFTSSSTVQWNGAARSTAFISSNQLAASILASDVATAGSFPVTVATPGFNNSNSVNFTVTATSSLIITTTSLPPSADGKSYYFLPATSGGTAPLTWTVTNGALPAGLTLDPLTGLISGSVTGVTSNFTVQASDSANPPNTALQNLSIIITTLGRNDNIVACGGTDQPTPISNGTLRASISPYGDVDTYSFTLTQTVSNLSVETFAQQLNIGNNLTVRSDFLDTVLELLDSHCTLLGLNDDIVVSTSSSVSEVQDSKIVVGASPFPPSPVCTGQTTLGVPCADKTPPTSLPAGTYYIRVRDYRGDGHPDFIYDLTVSGIE